ncbi:phosphate ABC transporter permease subunit PstC [Sedimentisphaera salicampi]|uniref:Phosphate transport system permease protein n=1 Tax=Sedimentisphaera salicampi TaxID=1941349 RepID=A0A1W6LLB9_9BACT|nr:phosphate ABC transporter permease subunit PstC [Sedimentisphaera salicampi]ARN56555.1 Phosphate transport system permease protein PstC [Sedimentisphaera salicampi]OXU15440.1 Phosphate transport system permease protein PstC [Sedimentisphaera salicampi]
MQNKKKNKNEFDLPLLLTPGQDIAGYAGRHIGRAVLFCITAFSVIAVLLILFFVMKQAWPFIASGKWTEFLSSDQWYPQAEDAEFGALAIVTGSFYVTLIAMLIASPIGLLSAVFLSDMAPFRLRQIVKPVIEILAAIPSVAYGFFAVLVLAPWLQDHFGFSTGTNALNAGIILAVMALPTIISVAEDALSSIGRDIREASYGLGATRAETMMKVVLPAAHSGIIAAFILGVMRAVGETMVVWMASGNANQFPSPWWDVSSSVRTMTATIAGEMGETPEGSEHRFALFALGVLLLIFTMLLNLLSEIFTSSFKRTMGGKR